MTASKPRLSIAGLRVLRVLLGAGAEPMSGADVGRATGVGSGTLYPLLGRLKVVGWLAGEWESGDPRVLKRPVRRLYVLTQLGMEKAREALGELQMPSSEVPGHGI